MRLLFLTPLFPFPPVSGGLIKTWTLLEFLRQRCDVDILCFQQDQLSPEQRAYAGSFPGMIETVHLDRGRNALNLLQSYLRGVPLSIHRNHSPRMSRLVEERVAGGTYDVVFCDHWLMAQYLFGVARQRPGEQSASGLKVLHLHNAETLVWRRQAELERNVFRRLLVAREARRVRRYEASLFPHFQRVFAVSEKDRQALIALGANPDRTSLLPNVPDPGLLERSGLSFDDAPPDVLYIGTLSWQPNAQGMQSFLREAMPKFADKLPGSRLMVAGSGPPSWLRDWAGRTPFLELVSPVLDVEALYRRARVFLEPVSGGGGTKLKVLNALARGLPVVTTPDGADGIAAIDGEHLLIGRDGDELLDRLSRVTQDRELWERLSKNGRELIRERYVPDIAYEPVAELLAKAT